MIDFFEKQRKEKIAKKLLKEKQRKEKNLENFLNTPPRNLKLGTKIHKILKVYSKIENKAVFKIDLTREKVSKEELTNLLEKHSQWANFIIQYRAVECII